MSDLIQYAINGILLALALIIFLVTVSDWVNKRLGR